MCLGSALWLVGEDSTDSDYVGIISDLDMLSFSSKYLQVTQLGLQQGGGVVDGCVVRVLLQTPLEQQAGRGGVALTQLDLAQHLVQCAVTANTTKQLINMQQPTQTMIPKT